MYSLQNCLMIIYDALSDEKLLLLLLRAIVEKQHLQWIVSQGTKQDELNLYTLT